MTFHSSACPTAAPSRGDARVRPAASIVHRFVTAAASGVLFTGAAGAQAQTSPLAEGAAGSQEVVISAARVPQMLPDTLPSTTVITRADIDAAPVTDLPGLLRTFTSFNVAQTGPLGSQTSVFLRGANSNQVLVLIDGAPLSRADFGSAPWELVPLDQIDHIEIVRGNLSSVYGAQAVGGVVQIFTRRGPGSSVSGAMGNRGQFAAAGKVGHRLGDATTPLDLSATLSAQATAGFSARDPAVDPTANPDRDPAYQGAATLGVGKTWAPGQRTEFSWMHSATHSDYDGYTPTVQQDTLTTQLDGFSLQSHHALAPALRLDLNLGETLEHFTDPTQALNTFGPLATTGSGRTRLLGAQIDWQVVADHSLQLQVEDRHERFGDELTPQRERRTLSERVGWLGTFADVVEVQANARHDDADDYGTANTGLLALGWRITPAWKLVGQASTAFSAPSFTDLEFAAGPLQPERSRDLELGVHWQGADWLARATWFSQRQHDLIGFNAQFQSVNIGHASNHGVELIADGALGPGKLGVDATFQDPRDDDADAPLLRRPRTVAAVNYRVPVLGWQTGLWVRYTGERSDVDPVSFALVDAPARTTLGLSAEHALAPAWTIAAKIDNLANTRTPEVLGYTAAPRSFLLQLRGQWQ
jgi:vitamin B12 transporter